MKKSVSAVLISLILILIISLSVNYFFIPLVKNWINQKTYSQTNCLTDNVEGLDIYELAKYYRDGKATVAVTANAYNTVSKSNEPQIHGSGVCIASKGYTTESGYTASKGSYIVTNYHVVDYVDSKEHNNIVYEIITEDEESYPCKVLWYNKDTDIAIVYCDDVNLNYVKMKDRWIDCDGADRLDFEQVFTIGAPLSLNYLNRLTVGNIAKNDNMMMTTEDTIYYSGSSFSHTRKSGYMPYNVLSNLYEDVIDIALGISGGNSGGGLFDKHGMLVGLTTLGNGNTDKTGGNQMNGAVGIYPAMQVLDRLIENNENSKHYAIYTLESMKIKGMDAFEAQVAKEYKENYTYYYLDDTLYPLTYSTAFDFDDYGYYILLNNGSYALEKNSYITSCSYKGSTFKIEDRNDLVYLLLKIKEGDTATFNCTTSEGAIKAINITF